MLSSADLGHLETAEQWLERGDYCNCFKELKRLDDRKDARVDALRWRLYNASGMRAAAADVALDIQRRYSKELAGRIWRSLSYQNSLAPVLLTQFA